MCVRWPTRAVVGGGTGANKIGGCAEQPKTSPVENFVWTKWKIRKSTFMYYSFRMSRMTKCWRRHGQPKNTPNWIASNLWSLFRFDIRFWFGIFCFFFFLLLVYCHRSSVSVHAWCISLPVLEALIGLIVICLLFFCVHKMIDWMDSNGDETIVMVNYQTLTIAWWASRELNKIHKFVLFVLLFCRSLLLLEAWVAGMPEIENWILLR